MLKLPKITFLSSLSYMKVDFRDNDLLISLYFTTFALSTSVTRHNI